MKPASTQRISWHAILAYTPRAALAIGALAVMARTPNFLEPDTLGLILALGSIVGVLALGQAFVLIGGGFDLSQGAILALTAAVAAKLAISSGMNPWLVAFVALMLGAALGAINGGCVAKIGTNPFVTTLSTQLIYRGAAFLLLQGKPINRVESFRFLDSVPFGSTVPGTRRRYLFQILASVPNRGFVFLALAALGWFVLSRTIFGRHVYAVGGNTRAAELSGLPTIRLRVATFAISGAASALAALMILSWVRVAKADTGLGMELDAIAACVVGGISLQGGSGRIGMAAVGSLVLQALGLCITMNGLPDEYRGIATGAVLLTFAAVDALARRAR